jgi:HlyD family secretion protein
MRHIVLLCFIMLLTSCDEKSHRFNGYVDAELVYLSSNYPGRLINLPVARGERVQKDQFLFKVEQEENDFAVKMSQLSERNLLEQKNELLNELQYDERNVQRIQNMRQHDAASQNDLDVAQKNLAVLKNKLAALDFQITSSAVNTADKQWALKRKEGYANQAGIIFDTYFTQDEYVQAGQPVLALVTPEHIKAIFFIPEPELRLIKLNSTIKIFSGDYLLGTGTINYISNIAQYTPNLIYSREESHNLVFRVEARIDSPELERIHLGLPVSLELTS